MEIHITAEQERLLLNDCPIQVLMSPIPALGIVCLTGPYEKSVGYVDSFVSIEQGLLCNITL